MPRQTLTDFLQKSKYYALRFSFYTKKPFMLQGRRSEIRIGLHAGAPTLQHQGTIVQEEERRVL
jgi:hypothetical protein